MQTARTLLADPNIESHHTGLRPLSTAISQGNMPLFSLLLEHRAVGAMANPADGTTALPLAAGRRDPFFFSTLASDGMAAAGVIDRTGLRP